ncbi:MAG: amino acid permease [Pseudomonadales bacterium]|jgi:APA family basic amino acid/polyamine antiporter|nr:amino acid permease [Pseudomonadales bacterium]
MSSKKFSANTAVAIVVANMIGTGVFTSLGFQLVDIQSTFVLMMLWLVGGVTALCGALTYAELGSHLPRSGGEYNFLKEIYHPAAGFISGWISATVGFAAPTALAAMTFGAYLEASLGNVSATLMASLLVIALTAAHAFSHAASGGVQTIFTIIKVLLVLLFVLLVGLAVDNPQPVRLLPAAGDSVLLTSSAFAVSLIYVNYAFTGWNAATYIINEVEQPEKSIPFVLFSGTLVVLVLYLMLNYIFLYAAPMSDMEGKIEIGVIVAQHAFGETGGMIMGLVLATLLISTVSAMIIAGPRVLQVIGEDFRLFRLLSVRNADGIPMIAIMVQSAVTMFFILTSTFESVLVFSGFVMGLNTFFAVAGVFLLRARDSESPGYRTWGYPVTPLVFLGLMAWTLVYILLNKPEEGVAGLLIVVAGALVYWGTERMNRRASDPS